MSMYFAKNIGVWQWQDILRSVDDDKRYELPCTKKIMKKYSE